MRGRGDDVDRGDLGGGRHQPGPGRRIIAGASLAVAATLVVLTVGYLYAHQGRPLPPPLWTEADLPTVPAAGDNGWALLASGGHGLSAVEAGDVLDPDDPARELGAAVWEEIGEDLEEDEAARRAIAARPHFIDACPSPLDDCPALQVHTLNLQRALGIVAGAHLGRWSRVAEEAETLSRQAAEFTATCRNLVACVIGAQGLETLMVAIELAAHEAHRRGAAPRRFLERLAGVVRTTPVPSPDIGRTVIADYLAYHRPVVSAAAAGSFEPLVDYADTLRRIDEMYLEAHTYASDPAAPRPAGWPQTEHPLWWLYNARGKRIAEMVSWGLDGSLFAIARYRDTLRGLDGRRGRAATAVDEAIAAAAADPFAPGPDTTEP